jgi:uncharacterized protein (DUF2141 family)
MMAAAASALLCACANIGHPEGGPRDVTPPVFVGSTPKLYELNCKKNKIELQFDEIVQLKDQSKKVVVSPVQHEAPKVSALGKKVTIELRDTLKPNTTYTIDFSDAIEDNNEGNPLNDFAFAFSTGDSIDSLQISGMVLRAKDLEPMQNVIVGIHNNLADSAFTTLPFDRIARTNDKGQFTIRSVKGGKYRIYALNDVDNNYKFARSEDLAFLGDVIVPSSYRKETSDTVFTVKHKVDTVVNNVHTFFTPNDILLSMFNEDYKSQYLVKHERPEGRRLTMMFGAPSDTLPTMKIIRPAKHEKNWYVLQHSEHNDTLNYWITDTNLVKTDSLMIEARYLHTDSTDHLTWQNDTLNFNLKKLTKKQKQEKAKVEKEKKKKQKDAKKKKSKPSGRKDEDDYAEKMALKKKREGGNDSIPEMKMLGFNLKSGSSQEVNLPLQFESDEPIDSINQAAIHLVMKKTAKDSVWTDATPAKLEQASPYNPLYYVMKQKWEPGAIYKITIDSMSVRSIYGLMNKTITQQITVKSLDEYANLYLNVNLRDSAFVELLNGSDALVRASQVKNGTAAFENVTPGTYYARLIKDKNGNGKWDTGNYSERLQPEEVYYFPKKITLKKNWDNEQTWNIYITAVDKQKPEEIKKNKPESKKGDQQTKKNTDEEDEENTNNPVYTGNKYTDSQNRTY